MYLKLLELLSTLFSVNLVTIALQVLKLHMGEGGGGAKSPRSQKVLKKAGSECKIFLTQIREKLLILGKPAS